MFFTETILVLKQDIICFQIVNYTIIYYFLKDFTQYIHTKKYLGNIMLRLHYVPGGHGNHVSGHRGRNEIDVTQRGGPYGQTWQAVIAVDTVSDF